MKIEDFAERHRLKLRRDADGTLVDDFRIHRMGNVVAVRNAPSPGATSSMAIAEHVVAETLRG